jgi:hypothetical protein
MPNTAERIRQELSILVTEGYELLNHAMKWEDKHLFEVSGKYQSWYSKALPVVQQLLPDRYAEFKEKYRIEKRKELNTTNYAIADFLGGSRLTQYGKDLINHTNVFTVNLMNQVQMLESAVKRLDSLLSDIRHVLQAELFDDELSVATELRKKNHFRAAGAVAGVVLEEHLKHLASKHPIKISKSDPTIAYLNDLLKDASIYDVPTWRFIQRLGDIRNLCVHSKERDPTSIEVEELIVGTEKIIKTVF